MMAFFVQKIRKISKLLFLCNLIGWVVCSISAGQQVANTGANVVDDRALSSNEAISIWAVPAEQKVRPSDRVERENLIWSGKERKISVAGAGNEQVPFQVVITVPIPPGRKPTPPGGFFISASELKSRDGKIIPRENIQFYLEHYVMLTGKSGPVGATGYWPDALAPVKEPFNMAAQYDIVKNRPVWVNLSIPSGISKGTYAGKITVTRDRKVIETLDIEVEVHGFSLPEERHLITYMNVSRGYLAQFYHKPASSEEIDKLTQKYYEFLYAHRMEPWFNDQLQPEITLRGEDVIVDFDDARYQYYMEKLKTRRVLLNTFPPALKRLLLQPLFSTDFNKKMNSYLSQVATYFNKHGWQQRLVFNSPIDEPNTKEDYEHTRRWADLVHEAAPGVPFLATESPVTDDPAWGVLNGKVNNFSIHGNALNDPQVKRAILEEQNRGGEMTWYISCDQKYPQPNYFVDAPALDLVMVPWITERYRMNGILYWAANFWSQTTNPWLNANTFLSGFECSGGYILNGEGSLLYPGDDVTTFTGQPNVDGPVSSIRFELLRDGIEDYEYLWMLKQAGDKKFADEMVKNLVVDVSAFSRNVRELYATRKAMAKRLEEIARW